MEEKTSGGEMPKDKKKPRRTAQMPMDINYNVSIFVDRILFMKFKALSIIVGKRYQDILTQFIKDYVDKHKNDCFLTPPTKPKPIKYHYD